MTVLSALAGARGPGRYATLVGAALAWVLVALSTPAAANATDAGAFIESMAEQAVKALTNKDISRDERIDRFRHLLRERFDVPVIGRWVLGRHWRRATDDQREEYLHLFEDLIILTYVDRFTDYSGETLRVVKTIQGSDRDSLVRSVLDRPGSEKPLEVDWRVRETDGELRVIDVIVAGISMGQSQKDQFASTLSKEGGRIGALLAKLRKQCTMAAEAVEAPSGKDAAYENFPVGSWLLPAALRPHIATFYAFARAIDDIADSPDLSPEEKVRRLDGFAQALAGDGAPEPGFEKGAALRRSLAETGVTPQHGLDLIAAFKQDAVKGRYADWDDLMGYCILSAAPVGRYLLDLHGGSDHGYGPSDALCNALQVINHLQDCQDDYRTLDRVYLPGDWMAEAGVTVADLDRPTCTPGLRRVIDRALDGTRALLETARPLPAGLRSRRLAMESGAILDIAHTLTDRLAHQDPLAGRVALGKGGFLGCCLRGALRGLFM